MKKYSSECGATMTEYVIALAILVGGLVVVNAFMLAAAKDKGSDIAEANVQMTPCNATDTSDVIRNAIDTNKFDRSGVCK